MVNKIPDFKKRLEAALYDPLERLAKELYLEGVTEEELWDNMGQLGYIPDTIRVKLANYLAVICS